jgi:hypothetical protein
MRPLVLLPCLAAPVLLFAHLSRAGEPTVAFEEHADRLAIAVGGRPFATYVWSDPKTLRPYFANLHAPDGTQLTRNHPPVAGTDATDHDTIHTGLWLAFGDVSGADFWRNKAAVEHVEFVEKPAVAGGVGSFAVKNRYVAEGMTICHEVCRIRIAPRAEGTLVDWQSDFSGPDAFYFGDQEEMGLGIRVATPITVKSGGHITNSDRLVDEKQVWGKQADWCDYSASLAGQEAGILIMPDPANFRRSWFHARDYGVLVANPFGQKAFTQGQASKVLMRPGEHLQLGFGILFHRGPVDCAAVYKAWLAATRPTK